MAAIVHSRRWVPVCDYEGFYEVSDRGEIRNVGYVLRDKYRVRDPPRTMRLHRTSPHSPSLRVTLVKDGERLVWNVAHLVLLSFRGLPPDVSRFHAVHRNGNVLDNRFQNLRWGTKNEANQQRPDSRIKQTWNNLRNVELLRSANKGDDGNGS